MNTASRLKADSVDIRRLRIVIRGAVQGVGFRPYVWRLARKLGLNGWINNSTQGVFVELEGDQDRLSEFLLSVPRDLPPRAFIQSLESSYLDSVGYTAFDIRESEDDGSRSAIVMPDIATCPECLAEVFDPQDRRYRYPFTNCTNCGPRYSIIDAVPYDRANMTMKVFEMCEQCRAEYENPADRRFHAQPNACPNCGPHIELWERSGDVAAKGNDAIDIAACAIRAGKILAIKGLGGFHLVVDARHDVAVHELRHRKHREEKPLAVMFPSLSSVEEVCEVDDLERRLLISPESPIVLLKKRHNADADELSRHLAPRNPYLGVMLPYTPLHHLLLREFNFPIVATSGNLSDEPICTDEYEALVRLHSIADLFLVHNRPIARHVDDSIVRVMMDREMVLRRARGFAPLPITLKKELPPILSVGAHLKNCVAISNGKDVFISQHIGDLETNDAFRAFGNVIESLERLYAIAPAVTACDKHPDYMSTRWSVGQSKEPERVQHHYAHVLSCMAENEIEAPALGIAWDGTGYGDDGTIWGGEFLHVNARSYERIAHLRTFMLPGGDSAIKEPRRSAIGVLYEIFGESVFHMDHLLPMRAFDKAELEVIRAMLARQINSPRTSSAGRLFDAVAAIVGISERCGFEGQAAMELEFAAQQHIDSEYGYEIDSQGSGPDVIDWEIMVRSLISELLNGMPVPTISAIFHNTLAEMMVSIARRTGEKNVVLSGGCFQNRYLTEKAITDLRADGFHVYWHQRVPPNDGGIALGQTIAAAMSMREISDERSVETVCV